MTTELKQRAEALRKELDALDKAIAKSQVSAYGLFDCSEGERGYFLCQSYANGGSYDVGQVLHTELKAVYREEAQADAVADAFNVFFRELPMCEGVVIPARDRQYVIATTDDLSEMYAEDFGQLYSKLASLSPTFDTKKNAEDAIKKVGADRILRAFKALKGMS